MLTDCRECGQPVANRAKTCPHCGVKKPTASKAEAGLAAFAAGAFKLGLMLCLLVIMVVACVAIVACSGPTAPTFEERQAEAGYDPQGRPLTTDTSTTRQPISTTTAQPTGTAPRSTTTTVSRPVYCGDYDTWATAEAKMDALEARHGPDTSTWPAGDVDALFAAMDRRAAAVERVWAQAPDTATIASVRAICTG